MLELLFSVTQEKRRHQIQSRNCVRKLLKTQVQRAAADAAALVVARDQFLHFALQDNVEEEVTFLVHERDYLLATIHRGRSGCAQTLEQVREVLRSYRWLAERRGSDEGEEDRYQPEVADMYDLLTQIIDQGLRGSRISAHHICCQGKRPLLHPEDPQKRA